MNLKYIFLFLVLMILLIIGLSIFPNTEYSYQSSFLDDLLAAVLGQSSSEETFSIVNCTPEFINFNISLIKGEMFNYTEILFDKDSGNIILNSSYFVSGEEYKNTSKCYTVEYKKQRITSYDKSSEQRFSEKPKISLNITIGENNGTFLFCEGENMSCRDYLLIEHPFFGLLNENFSIHSAGKTHYIRRYGVYQLQGDVYPKTGMKVIGKEKFNGREVYVMKITAETFKIEKKTVKAEIFSTSYLWIDTDKGIIVKGEEYIMGDKAEELKLIS